MVQLVAAHVLDSLILKEIWKFLYFFYNLEVLKCWQLIFLNNLKVNGQTKIYLRYDEAFYAVGQHLGILIKIYLHRPLTFPFMLLFGRLRGKTP